MTKRQSGLDVLRCFAALMVITVHSFLSNGYTVRPQIGPTMWLAGSIQLMVRSSIGIYLMLTGYLQSHKTDWRACYRSLPAVLVGYLLVAFISIPIRHFVHGDVQSLSTWLQRLFGFSGAYYGWYVEVYVGLTLLTPLINRGLKHSGNKALLGYAAILLVLTSLPGLTPWLVVPNYWKNLYPISYYILGAIFRRIQPKIKPLFGFLVAFGSALLMGTVTILSTDRKFEAAITWSFGDLGIVLVSVGLFIGMYRLNLPQWLGKVFAFLATGCFGSYLLSHLLDAWWYNLVMPWKREGRFLLIFLCVTVPIYIVSLFMGIGLDRITRLLLKLGQKVGGRVKERFLKNVPVAE